MKPLLNTLYVTTQGAYLARENEAVVVRIEKETRMRLPLHALDGIVCFGRVSCSPPLMGLCAERGVRIAFLTERGRFLARVEGKPKGNVLLRRTQYRLADDPKESARLARSIVVAKVMNSRSVLQRALRDHGDAKDGDALRRAVGRLRALLTELGDETLALDSVRGHEGEAARVYYAAFNDLITVGGEAFRFSGRSRRPPLDKINALLSFVYTLVRYDAESALASVGLDPAVGFLHRDRPGRPGLALDLMEEFRAFLADRLAASLVNLRQINPSGFQKTETGAVHMDDATRKQVIVAYQKRKQDDIRHPFLGETCKVGLLFHLQAQLLARHLRNDLDAYPPFVMK